MDGLGERLRRLRKEKKLIQKEVADQLNIISQTYSRYENNTRVPDYSMLIELANYYEVITDFLLGIDRPNMDKNMFLKLTNQLKGELALDRLGSPPK